VSQAIFDFVGKQANDPGVQVTGLGKRVAVLPGRLIQVLGLKVLRPIIRVLCCHFLLSVRGSAGAEGRSSFAVSGHISNAPPKMGCLGLS